jgi:hypothetical protein
MLNENWLPYSKHECVFKKQLNYPALKRGGRGKTGNPGFSLKPQAL